MEKDYILVIGSLNYDIIFSCSRLPKKGETFLADHATMCAGGKGANQAVQCAKLGVKTYMAGKVGKDNFGYFLKNNLQNYNVQKDFVFDSTKATGMGSIQALPDGSVYATISAGANDDLDQNFLLKVDHLIGNCSILLLQMEIPIPILEKIINTASKYQIYIILNAAPAKKIDSNILKKVNTLVVNEEEASFYSKQEVSSFSSAKAAGDKLLQQVKESVIITLGKKGSLLVNSSGYSIFETNVLTKAVETTGAGDSYIGAFAVAKYYQYSDEKACTFANKVSQITVTRIGAQISMPTIAEISID